MGTQGKNDVYTLTVFLNIFGSEAVLRKKFIETMDLFSQNTYVHIPQDFAYHFRSFVGT